MPVLLHYPHPPPPSSSPIVAPRNRDGGREGRKEIETNSSLRLACQPCLALPSYLRSNELCGILALGFPVLDSGFHSSSNATNPPSRSPVPEELLPPGIRSAESSWIGGALRLLPNLPVQEQLGFTDIARRPLTHSPGFFVVANRTGRGAPACPHLSLGPVALAPPHVRPGLSVRDEMPL
jgi:hypothetical protein